MIKTSFQQVLPVATQLASAPKNTVTTIRLGERGPAGPAGGGGYEHTQASALATWIINHNLGRKTNTEVFTVGGSRMLAEVVNISNNQTQVIFDSPQTGYAVTN